MAEIFNIQLETDLSEFNSTVTDDGDLAQSGAAALAGSSGGMACLIDDATAIYGQKDFTQITSSAWRLRVYLDPNSLTMASGDEFWVLALRYNVGNRFLLELHYDGTNYEIRAETSDDASSWHQTAYYDITNEEHYIEVLLEYASSSSATDAVLTLWIDGAQQEQVTDFNLYDLTKPNNARLGMLGVRDAGTSGTYYLDEFVFRDDDTEIGPVAAPAIRIPRYGFTNFQVPGIV